MVQADICQLGMDQRKVNMLAREYCDECVPKRKLKPVVLSHPMMPGLLQVRCFSRALNLGIADAVSLENSAACLLRYIVCLCHLSMRAHDAGLVEV